MQSYLCWGGCMENEKKKEMVEKNSADANTVRTITTQLCLQRTKNCSLLAKKTREREKRLNSLQHEQLNLVGFLKREKILDVKKKKKKKKKKKRDERCYITAC